jgi:hypothetical protein
VLVCCSSSSSNSPVGPPDDADASADADAGANADANVDVGGEGGTLPSNPSGPAVERGGKYFSFGEQFNRYYTDKTWTPTSQIFVSPTGTGDGKTHDTPTSVATALGAVAPGVKVTFLSGTYSGCFGLESTQSGTYDAPIVLYAERNAKGGRGVHIDCCSSDRMTCINLENASYVAVDGFELQGGKYGLRSVGADYAASQHQKGTAALNNEAWGQTNDPFFTGEADWAVFEHNVGHDVGTGDGHGMYLSNGSDWNIVRFNETYNTRSSDFQVNADPLSTCDSPDLTPNPDCDALAGTPGDGGKGASDFMLIDSNYFHHGLAQGPNFTSMRHSVVRNNVFALYAKHNTSFWQETNNPNLGASDNVVEHNLMVGDNADHALQFVANSTRNTVKNNVLVGVIVGKTVTANPSTVLLEVDNTTSDNVYAGNYYIGGTIDGRNAGANETARPDFDAAWFTKFPSALPSVDEDWRPTPSAPFLKKGELLPDAPVDRAGQARVAPVDLGPFNSR